MPSGKGEIKKKSSSGMILFLQCLKINKAKVYYLGIHTNMITLQRKKKGLVKEMSE